jgi:hypothetical protein
VATRKRDEPVTRLMEECGVNTEPFIDPELERVEEGGADYLTPNSAFGPYKGGRARAEVRSAPVEHREEGMQELAARSRTRAGGGRLFRQSGVLSPGFGMAERGVAVGANRIPMKGPPMPAAHHVPFAPQVQRAGFFAETPAIPEPQAMHPNFQPQRQSPFMQRRAYGEIPGQQEYGGVGRRRGAGREDLLEERIELLERQRNEERARGAITAEMRRMQASLSPTEHPGLYSQMDQNAIIHDCPPSHRGIMALTAACMASTKNVDIKFTYLADAEYVTIVLG